MTRSERYQVPLGYLLLFLSQSMVAVNIVASKFVIERFPTVLLLETRFIFATLVMTLFSLRKPSSFAPVKYLSRRDWWLIFWQAMTAGFMFNILLLTGLHYTSASIAAVIASTIPAIIAILCYLILKEKLSRTKVLSIGFATFGVIMINIAKPIDNSHNVFGDFIILLALLPEAMYYILVKIRAIRLPISVLSLLLNALNAIVFLPLAIVFTSKEQLQQIHLIDWLIVFVIGIASALFFSFWSKGSEHISPSSCALMTATMPISAITIAMVFLGEQLIWLQWAGVIAIVLAIIVSTRS